MSHCSASPKTFLQVRCENLWQKHKFQMVRDCQSITGRETRKRMPRFHVRNLLHSPTLIGDRHFLSWMGGDVWVTLRMYFEIRCRQPVCFLHAPMHMLEVNVLEALDAYPYSVQRVQPRSQFAVWRLQAWTEKREKLAASPRGTPFLDPVLINHQVSELRQCGCLVSVITRFRKP